MRRHHVVLVIVLALCVGLVGLSAQTKSAAPPQPKSAAPAAAPDPLKSGTVLQRIDIKGAKGLEGIAVLRELPAGGSSGKHTQAGNEIVCIIDGSVIFEAQGKPAKTIKSGESFTTAAGEVHSVTNASKTAGAKAIAFYVAKKGTALEDLGKPVK
jgi:quercetin dioxygenase-like cupin family protein